MNQEFINLLKSLGFFTIGSFSLVGLIGYIAKGVFDNYLKNKLEEHKNNIILQNEKIKQEYEIEKARSVIKFTKIHEERANLILKLHSLLIEFRQYLTDIYNGDCKINLEEFEIKKDSIISLYRNKKLYFKNKTIIQLNQLIEFFDNYSDMIQKKKNYAEMVEKSLQSEEKTAPNHEDMYTDVSIIEKEIRNKIQLVLGGLESSFRETLGIE